MTTIMPTVTTTGLLILDTQHVTPAIGDPYYEIAAGLKPEGPPTIVVVTRDEALYQAAMAVEQEPVRVDLTWHAARQAGSGHWGKILDTIAASTSEGPR